METAVEENCDVPLGIVVGQKYNSFEEFDKFLTKSAKTTQVRLYKRNSRTIDAASKKARRYVNPDLKFVHLKYACVHGGKKFKSKGKGVRVKPTLKEKLCDAHITLKISSSGNELEVSDVSNLHNHQVPIDVKDENSENKPDLGTKCRSCLSYEENMLDLFLDHREDKTLADIVENTTSIKVEEGDGLPRFMCPKCANIIFDFHKFKAVFQENEIYLRNSLKNCNEKICVADSDTASDTDAFDTFSFDLVKVEFKESPSVTPDKDEQSLLERQAQLSGAVRGKNKRLPHKSKLNKVKRVARHICNLCSQGYGQKVRIRAHLLKKHDICTNYEEHYTRIIVKREPNQKLKDPKDNLLCGTCKELFKTKEELRAHLKTHRDFICEECGAAFNKKSYLRDHMEVHEKVFKFVCPFCGKAFKRRGPFGKHKKIHTHPGHAVCEACGQRFNSTSCLRTHFMLKHIRSKNYRCEVCGKSFSLKATLQKHHSRKHAGERERSFRCDICDMAYKDKSTLNRHIKMKHDKTYTKPTCHICKKEYSETINLSKHMARHHRHEHVNPEPINIPTS